MEKLYEKKKQHRSSTMPLLKRKTKSILRNVNNPTGCCKSNEKIVIHLPLTFGVYLFNNAPLTFNNLFRQARMFLVFPYPRIFILLF